MPRRVIGRPRVDPAPRPSPLAKPGAAIRLYWTDGGVSVNWLTLSEARALLGELARAVRQAESESIAARNSPRTDSA